MLVFWGVFCIINCQFECFYEIWCRDAAAVATAAAVCRSMIIYIYIYTYIYILFVLHIYISCYDIYLLHLSSNIWKQFNICFGKTILRLEIERFPNMLIHCFENNISQTITNLLRRYNFSFEKMTVSEKAIICFENMFFLIQEYADEHQHGMN